MLSAESSDFDHVFELFKLIEDVGDVLIADGENLYHLDWWLVIEPVCIVDLEYKTDLTKHTS